MIAILRISPFQGLGFVALPSHSEGRYRLADILRPFRAMCCSPEGASSANDGHSPSDKTSLITSRERAIDNSVAVTPLAVIKHKLWDSRS